MLFSTLALVNSWGEDITEEASSWTEVVVSGVTTVTVRIVPTAVLAGTLKPVDDK